MSPKSRTRRSADEVDAPAEPPSTPAAAVDPQPAAVDPAEVTPPATPTTGPGALRRVLGGSTGFATIVELVPVGRRAG